MRIIGLVFAITAVFLAGCSNAPQQEAEQQETQQASATPGNYRATWKSVPELQDIMDSMVEGSAEALWNVAIDEYVPKNGEDWEKLDHAAVTLIQTGKLLKISDVAKKNPDWPKDADRFIAQAEAAREAVKDRNLDTLLSVGDDLNEACINCHNRYFEDQ